jgi:hypothetical protein
MMTFVSRPLHCSSKAFDASKGFCFWCAPSSAKKSPGQEDNVAITAPADGSHPRFTCLHNKPSTLILIQPVSNLFQMANFE